jgi:Flp pilus assembly protein TadD
MIAATVNLHHFILDGVIWKLRDPRLARVLLRDTSAHEPVPKASTRSTGFAWITPVAWAIGIACVGVYFVGTFEFEVGVRQALNRNDPERAVAAADRLAWIGRDSAKIRLNTGLAQARAGDVAAGITQIEHGVRLFETAEGWGGLGSLYEQDDRIDDAIEAYRRAQELAPPSPELMNNLAWLLALHRTGQPAAVEEAIELARAASKALDDENPSALDTLAVAYAAAGRFDAAQRVATRAVELARAAGNEATAAEIGERLALYRRGRAYTP